MLTFDLISHVQLCLTFFELQCSSVNACVDVSFNCRYILILQMAVVQSLLFFHWDEWPAATALN